NPSGPKPEGFFCICTCTNLSSDAKSPTLRLLLVAKESLHHVFCCEQTDQHTVSFAPGKFAYWVLIFCRKCGEPRQVVLAKRSSDHSSGVRMASSVNLRYASICTSVFLPKYSSAAS